MVSEAREILANYKRIQNTFYPNRAVEKSSVAVPVRVEPLALPAPKPVLVKNDHITQFESEILKQLLPLSDSYGSGNNTDHISVIIKETSDACGVPSETLHTNNRAKAVMFARHVACWRVRRETGISYSKIARIFKRYDDYSTSKSFKRIEAKVNFVRNPMAITQPKRPKAKTARPPLDEYAPRGGPDVNVYSGLASKVSPKAGASFRRFKELITPVKQISDSYTGVQGLDTEKHVDVIVKEVSKVFNLNPRMAIGVRRDARTATAKHLIFWRLRRELSLSYPQIGSLMGGMCYTTVMYGCARIESIMRNRAVG